MGKVNIELSGITSTSTYPDGEMISLVNLRKKGGALEPVSPRGEVLFTVDKYEYIFHHNLPQGGVNRLGYRDSAVFMVLEDGTESTYEPIIQGLVEFKSMAQIGNVVSILDDNGIKYLLWENSTYKLVSILSDGSSPDLTSLVGGIDFKVRTFYTPDTSDISPSHSSEFESRMYSTDNKFHYSTYKDANTAEALLARYTAAEALYLKALSIEARDGRLSGFFLVCAAIEMFDGTYILHEMPQLMCQPGDKETRYEFTIDGITSNYKTKPAAFDLIYNWADSFGWPELEKDVADGYYKGNYYGKWEKTAKFQNSEGASHLRTCPHMLTWFYNSGNDPDYPGDPILINMVAGRLEFMIKGARRPELDSIVKSVSIFITPQVSMFKTSRFKTSVKIKRYLPGFPPRDNYIDNYAPDIRTDSEIISELMEQENFYKVHEVPYSSLVSSTWVVVDLAGKLGEALYSREQLPIDSFSHHKITPKLQYTYNSQLHIANYKRTLSRGWPLRSFKNMDAEGQFSLSPDLKTADEAVRSLEYVSVDIKTDQGSTKVVRSGGAKYAQSFDMYNLMPILSYPDRRATKMTLFRQYEGTPSVTERGVFISETSPVTIGNRKIVMGEGTGGFSGLVKELDRGTMYFYRAYEYREGLAEGLKYTLGSEMSFTTKSGIPTMAIDPVTGIGAEIVSFTGEVTADNGAPIMGYGFCWTRSAETPAVLPLTNVLIGSGVNPEKFSETIESLTHNTTYYVRVYAENSYGVHYSNAVEFKTLSGAPTELVVNSTEALTATSITVKTTVKANTEAPTIKRGLAWFLSDEMPSDFIEGGFQELSSPADNSEGYHPESVLPKGTLTRNTKYYFRAYARSRFGLFFSENTREVTTLSGSLSSPSPDAEVTSTTSIIFTGKITDDGGTAVLERGAAIGKNSDGSDGVKHLVPSIGVGEYKVFIFGLEKDTTFYIRTYVKNEFGEHFSPSLEVKTMSGEPLLDLLSVSDIRATQFTAVAYVSVLEDVLITRRGFSYNTTGISPLDGGDYIDIIATTQFEHSGSFTATIDELDRSTTYYVWAYAIVGEPYYQSDMMTVTTTDAPLLFAGSSVHDVGIESATFKINLIDDGGIPVHWMGVMWSRTEGGGWNQLLEEWDPGVFRISIPTENLRKGVHEFYVNDLLQGLTDDPRGEVFYYRAFGSNGGRMEYSSWGELVTLDGVPRIRVLPPTEITLRTAILRGSLVDESGAINYGGTPVIARGVMYQKALGGSGSTTPDGGSSRIERYYMGSTDEFSVFVTDLEPNTHYIAWAFVTNRFTDTPKYMSSPYPFTTGDGQLTVDTMPAKNIHKTSAVTGVVITSNPGQARIAVKGVYYIKSSLLVGGELTWNTPYSLHLHRSILSDSSPLEFTLPDLSPLTEYTARAYARSEMFLSVPDPDPDSDDHLYLGDAITFTTKSASEPEVGIIRVSQLYRSFKYYIKLSLTDLGGTPMDADTDVSITLKFKVASFDLTKVITISEDSSYVEYEIFETATNLEMINIAYAPILLEYYYIND